MLLRAPRSAHSAFSSAGHTAVLVKSDSERATYGCDDTVSTHAAQTNSLSLRSLRDRTLFTDTQ